MQASKNNGSISQIHLFQLQEKMKSNAAQIVANEKNENAKNKKRKTKGKRNQSELSRGAEKSCELLNLVNFYIKQVNTSPEDRENGCITQLSLAEVLLLRFRYVTMRNKQKTDDYYKMTEKPANSNSELGILKGVHVSKKVLAMVMRVDIKTIRTWDERRKAALEETTFRVGTMKFRERRKAETIHGFISHIIDIEGESDPTNASKVYLPNMTSYPKAHQDYIEFCKNMGTPEGEIAGLSWFKEKFREYEAMIVVPKKTPLGKCSKCVAHGVYRDKVVTKNSQRDSTQELEFAKHRKLFTGQRAHYAANRDKARNSPGEFISMIADCSTKLAACTQPITRSLKVDQSFFLKNSGILVHGVPDLLFYYLFPDLYVKGASDIVMTSLFETIKIVKNQEKHRNASTLLLQLDNCKGENKNRYMIGFAALLVKWGWFRRVQISFMITGHTHEDIDRMHSIFRKAFWAFGCFSPYHFLQIISKCYQSSGIQARAFWNVPVYGFKKILNGMKNRETTETRVHKFPGISDPHEFCIAKASNSRICVWFRDFSCDQSGWLGKETRIMEFCDENPEEQIEGIEIFNRVPRECPPIINCPPIPPQSLSILRRILEQGLIPEEHRLWYNQIIAANGEFPQRKNEMSAEQFFTPPNPLETVFAPFDSPHVSKSRVRSSLLSPGEIDKETDAEHLLDEEGVIEEEEELQEPEEDENIEPLSKKEVDQVLKRSSGRGVIVQSKNTRWHFLGVVAQAFDLGNRKILFAISPLVPEQGYQSMKLEEIYFELRAGFLFVPYESTVGDYFDWGKQKGHLQRKAVSAISNIQTEFRWEEAFESWRKQQLRFFL
jgi:hypothetical protein